jgi:IS1 family transposase
MCGQTFSERHGTLYAGLRTDERLVTIVVTLLVFGCPVPAIVQAYGLDERTVASWRNRAGKQSQAVHEALVMQGKLALDHVQADEIRVKGRGFIAWVGMALMVSTRLWLGSVVSVHRDRCLADSLMACVRRCAKSGCALLICVDGWRPYPNAILRTFRTKVPRPKGERGRCHLRVWPELGIAQIIKHTTTGFALTRRIYYGTTEFMVQQLFGSQGGILPNTAFIERLNATFRQRLAPLVRRCRHAAARLDTLHTSLYLLGTAYNFCTPHQALRRPNFDSPNSPRWLAQTPAMAAGITDHVWSIAELLSFRVAPPLFVPPKRRGRPPKSLLLPSTT